MIDWVLTVKALVTQRAIRVRCGCGTEQVRAGRSTQRHKIISCNLSDASPLEMTEGQFWLLRVPTIAFAYGAGRVYLHFSVAKSLLPTLQGLCISNFIKL